MSEEKATKDPAGAEVLYPIDQDEREIIEATERAEQGLSSETSSTKSDTAAEAEDDEDAAHIVDWASPSDPENPQNWPSKRKWITISLVSAIAFNQAMSSTIFAPGVPNVLEDFDSDNKVYATLLVSIFVIGLAVGPLFLAPLSELYGRTPVMHATNFAFLVSSLLCAVSVNMPMLLVFRLTMGISSVNLGGGYVADMMRTEQRSRAMNIWNLGPVSAPIVGPIAGGYISLSSSWRWTFGLVSILAAVLSALCYLCLHESYPPRILELKARRLRDELGDPLLRSKYDKGQTPRQLIYLSVTRPSRMLLHCPIVGLVSVFLGVAYSYLYLLFTIFPDVWKQTYGFNSGEAGVAYLGLGIGAWAGQYALDVFIKTHQRRQLKKRGVLKPEDQLPPLVAGALTVSLGLFWYGWTAEYKIHWIVPILGTALCGFGITLTFLGVLTYLVDAFTLYAASALAASTMIRSVFGVTIPLAGPPLYEKLGLGWGNTLLGMLSLAIVPMSLGLMRYGERIRSNPRYQPNL